MIENPYYQNSHTPSGLAIESLKDLGYNPSNLYFKGRTPLLRDGRTIIGYIYGSAHQGLGFFGLATIYSNSEIPYYQSSLYQ